MIDKRGVLRKNSGIRYLGGLPMSALQGRVIGLHHIGVKTADMEASVRFYEMIGFANELSKTLPNGTKLAFMRAGSCVVELIGPADKAQVAALATDGIVAHIAIEVRNIEALVDEYKAKGIKFDAEAPGAVALFANGSKNIFFRGPNKEHLELFEVL